MYMITPKTYEYKITSNEKKQKLYIFIFFMKCKHILKKLCFFLLVLLLKTQKVSP